MPSPLAVAVAEPAIGLAADWTIAQGREEVTERTGGSPAALQYVEADLSELERTATRYRQAYLSAKLQLAALGQSDPDTGNALVACSQFHRLPEMAEISKAIDALHRVGAYSESLADDIVQRLRADMQGTQRRMEQQLANQRKALTRRRAAGSNGRTLPHIAGRNLAVGFSKEIGEIKRNSRLIQHEARDLHQRVAVAVAELKTTLRDMQQTQSRFIRLDRRICREFRNSLGGGW